MKQKTLYGDSSARVRHLEAVKYNFLLPENLLFFCTMALSKNGKSHASVGTYPSKKTVYWTFMVLHYWTWLKNYVCLLVFSFYTPTLPSHG